MYTAQKIHDRAITILDALSDSGTVDPNDTEEYGNRAPMLLDMWQKEIAKNSDLYKTFELSCKRKENLLGDTTIFQEIYEFNGTDKTFEAIGVNCFFIRVNDNSDIYIEEKIGGTWTNVTGQYTFNGGANTSFNGHISVTVTSGTFPYVKGTIAPSNQTNSIRIKMSGTYYYQFKYPALSSYRFATADKVPMFEPWAKVTMPSDFKSRVQVINEFPAWQYESDSQHKWENNKDLYVQFGYEGTIRISYKPIPVEITSLSQTLEVDDISAMSGAYYLAEHYALADKNEEIAAKCRDKFRELKLESIVKQPMTATEIRDVYSLT